jgi:hypothetical protein
MRDGASLYGAPLKVCFPNLWRGRERGVRHDPLAVALDLEPADCGGIVRHVGRNDDGTYPVRCDCGWAADLTITRTREVSLARVATEGIR